MKKPSLTILIAIVFSFAMILEVNAQGVPQPFRIGGIVTIDGAQITQTNDDGLVITVTKSDGTNYTDSKNNHPQDSDGLNASNFYLIDIPIYSADYQPGGAHPGDTARLHVFNNGKELFITAPSNGSIPIGESGSIAQVDVTVTQAPTSIPITVPDTGQRKCYNATAEIPCPTPGQPFYGQNGNYSIKPMSYTKLDENGNALSNSATYWVMLRDNVTGLIWEMKTNLDGDVNYNDPHDADNTYTWFDSNPDTNGGVAGTPGDGTDTEDIIKAMNDAHYGGYSDWRLPTIKELAYIVNYSIPSSGPTIDTGYFPNTAAANPWYWTSTNCAYGDTPTAFSINFGDGKDYYGPKSNGTYVRAVRGEQSGLSDFIVNGSFDAVDSRAMDAASTAAGSYMDNDDGTVTDTSTGLIWQQTSISNTMTWEQALAYCEGLSLGGYTDWRLPSIKELRSLVDYSQNSPTINTTYFLNTVSSIYWSSTTYTNGTSNAWGVNFSYGNDTDGSKGNVVYARAVRGGQYGSLGSSVLVSNSIGSRNTVKISDMSGTLTDSGAAITVSAWDVNGNALPESGGAAPLMIYNYETNSIAGIDLAARFASGTPMLYKFSIDASKVVITNVKNSTNDTFKVPIVYLNGVTNFVSNAIGNYNTIKVSDMSGTLAAAGSPISVKAWDANGNALTESASAPLLYLYSHGTISVSGSSLAARFPSGSPMIYEFTVQSAKMLITNVKSSTDGKLNVPIAYTSGVSNFVSNSIGNYNTLEISDLSGVLASGGGAISVKAWDASGNALTESASAAPLKLYNHGTTNISGLNLAARFPGGKPIAYDFSIESSKLLITNVKSSTDGLVEIPSIFASGISKFATNYVSSLNTVKISDMSGVLPVGGSAISIAAWDINGNAVLESGSAAPLKLYNLGTTTILGSDLAARFPSGAPKLYEFSIDSSNAIVTSLTTSVDGTIKTPTVFTIGGVGGI